jgi:hypothetical protein
VGRLGPRFRSGVSILVAAAISGCGPSAGTDDEGDGSPTPSPDPFVDAVASVSYGEGAGFGQDRFPDVVLGPPVGVQDPCLGGSTDVLSLGIGGQIVVEFTDIVAVDGDGADLLVFENPFNESCDAAKPFVEPGRVAVSEDGVEWLEFPCDPETPPYTGCAGVHPVYSSPTDGIPPTDPAVAGGDAFDLAEVGLSRARFVRIVDAGLGDNTTPSSGFDLDAMAVIHGE